MEDGRIWPLLPVRSHLIGGHRDERRGGSFLTDGDLHALQLWGHFALQEEAGTAHDVHESTRARLCQESVITLVFKARPSYNVTVTEKVVDSPPVMVASTSGG